MSLKVRFNFAQDSYPCIRADDHVRETARG